MPSKLYKYLPDQLDRIGDILVHRRVFFSSPTEFNDPFDCARGVRFPDLESLTKEDEDVLRRYLLYLAQERGDSRDDIAHKRDAEANLERIIHGDIELVRGYERTMEEEIAKWGKTLGVFCLSATPHSVSMWAHYASDHRGVVIEFDTTRLRDDKDKVHPSPVSYSRSLPTLQEFLAAVDAVNSGDPTAFWKLVFCRKSEEWESEQEWRTFTRPPNRFLGLPPGTITQVIFGYKMTEETRRLIEVWVRDCDPPVQLAKSIPSSDSFEMILQPSP